MGVASELQQPPVFDFDTSVLDDVQAGPLGPAGGSVIVDTQLSPDCLYVVPVNCPVDDTGDLLAGPEDVYQSHRRLKV